MIEVKNLSKSFGSHLVLDQVSVTAEPGKIYGLVGYNGVGKTTLMKLICGVYRPDQGIIQCQGKPVYENPAIKKDFFLMTEETGFFAQSSLRDMKVFYKRYYPRWSDHTYQGLLQWFGLEEDVQIGKFSKGMQRQACLLLAFSTRCRHLLLDEAFDGLDHTMRMYMRDMLRYYVEKEQAVLVVSSHNLEEIAQLSDRIGLLNQGRLAEAEPEHIMETYLKEQAVKEVNWHAIFP